MNGEVSSREKQDARVKMAAYKANKEVRQMEKFFKTKRIETPEGAFLECLYREGTQELDTSKIPKDLVPGTADVMIAIKVLHPEYVKNIFSINPNGYRGYIVRLKGTQPVLPNGEMTIKGQTVTVREPTPIRRKIKKQTGELHISDIPLEIPLEATVEKFEEKFNIKVMSSKLATIPMTNIYNGTRIFEIEKSKLKEIKRAFYLFGFLAKSWYKGCIYDRTCNRCGNKGHAPHKCPKNTGDKEQQQQQQQRQNPKQQIDDTNPKQLQQDLEQQKQQQQQQQQQQSQHLKSKSSNKEACQKIDNPKQQQMQSQNEQGKMSTQQQQHQRQLKQQEQLHTQPRITEQQQTPQMTRINTNPSSQIQQALTLATIGAETTKEKETKREQRKVKRRKKREEEEMQKKETGYLLEHDEYLDEEWIKRAEQSIEKQSEWRKVIEQQQQEKEQRKKEEDEWQQKNAEYLAALNKVT